MASQKKLNLDALIPREDLDTKSGGIGGQSGGDGIPVSELARNKLHYNLLRKPDFQRETNDWDIDNVVTLIRSFRDADLIPGLIMWRSEAGFHFVIDGAHRLSAFIAWVNDDYGNGLISREFFENKIPRQQEAIAEECRKKVAAEVGLYSDLSKALTDENPTPQRVLWASNISKSLTTQWVGGDAAAAERSFIAINQRSVQIDDTERYMIEARRKPHVIAARALIRSATGHEYWSKFGEDTKSQIKKRAGDIYDILFEPEHAELMKTIEMPVAGKAYSAESLRIALELINFANNIQTKSDLERIQDDKDGSNTVRFLDKTHGVVKYMSGDGPASLGLHPAVYFWGATGRHHPSAFLAIVRFLQNLISTNSLPEFCFSRARFEEFLVTRNIIVKHVLGKFGGWKKSVPTVLRMYEIILDGLRSGKSEEEIEAVILSDQRFAGLADAIQLEANPNKRISRETKIAVRRRELLVSAVRCSICHARLSSETFSDDHHIRSEDGGRGSEANIQLTHPYCNHGFKEHLVATGKPLPTNPFDRPLQVASQPS